MIIRYIYRSFFTTLTELQIYSNKLRFKFAFAFAFVFIDQDMICSSRLSWPVIFEPKKSPKEHQFWISETTTDDDDDDDDEDYGVLPLIKNNNDNDNINPKPDLLSNPNSSPNSASSSEAINAEEDLDGLNQFKVVNAENLNILTNALEKKVMPWHKDVIPGIASSILECRSGMMRKLSKQRENDVDVDVVKEETWLLFLGADHEAKLKVGRELARLVFGSQTSFVSLSLSNFADSSNNKNNEDNHEMMKRKRSDESGSSYVQRLGEALNENPHRVFFMEDIEQVDYCSLKGIKQAIQSGRVKVSDGETVPVKDAIIIFSCQSFISSVCSPKRRTETQEITKEYSEMEKKNSSVSLDLNIAINNDDQDNSSGAGDDIGILQYVDKQIIFRVQEL